MITLSNVLVLAAVLFCISVAGIFLNRKNILIILMCIELMLLSVNMNFIAFSHFMGDINGDMAKIRNLYQDITGRHPKKKSPVLVDSKAL